MDRMVSERSNAKEPRKLFLKHIVRKIFLEDWAMKLVALVITLGLWLGVTGLSTPTTKRIRVPLNLSVSNNTGIINAQREVEIVISGDKRKIDQIVNTELVASIDLTDVPAGDQLVSLTPESVSVQVRNGNESYSLPQGTKLVEVFPIRILVKLEAVEEKEVDVAARTQGKPSAGFEVYSISVLPQKIGVRGPAKFIVALDHVDTDKIDLTGKKSDFVARQIPVMVDNPQAAVLNPVVDVSFKIGEKRVERTFTIPVTGSPGQTATFTIYGPRTLLTRTRAESFKVENVKNENGEDVPRLTLPSELQDVVEKRGLLLNPQ